MPTAGENWRVLSEAASREQDPERLLELVEELNRVLSEQELERRARARARFASNSGLLTVYNHAV
jgi:hypothetical protein